MFAKLNNEKKSSFKLGVIGGGATAVRVLNDLLENIDKLGIKKSLEIVIFDPKKVGSGLAYSENSTSLLLNVLTRSMSLDSTLVENFYDWCIKNDYIQENHDKYLPRYIFGLYLKEIFERLAYYAIKKDIIVKHIKEEVIDIKINKKYFIQTHQSYYDHFDFLILATGNSEPLDLYDLNGLNNYINNPYPLSHWLSNITESKNIGILGTGLTAIDVAVSLIDSGFKNDVFLYSRNGHLPAVKSVTHPYKMINFTKEKLINIPLEKHSLFSVFNILKDELNSSGETLRNIFINNLLSDTPSDFISKEINEAQFHRKWQSIMIGTNDSIEFFWDKLSDKDKRKFLKKYHSIWMAKRCPMPLNNANKLNEALKSGQIKVVGGLQTIQYEKNNFKLYLKNQSVDKRNVLINATGPARSIHASNASLLFKNLINNGLIRENPFGGLDVDFNSASVIDKNNTIHPNMRAIGHITCGAYYYTSSFEMISRRSKKIALDVTNLITG